MAVRTPKRGDNEVDGEAANSSDNVEQTIGIITLVIDKSQKPASFTTALKNIEIEELRLVLQQFSRLVDNAILEIEKDKIKQTGG